MSNRNAYTGPRRQFPPRRSRMFVWGYWVGRLIGFIRSLFGRKSPPRPRSPYRWIWWCLGIGLALMFWQWILVALILLLGAAHGAV